MEARPAVTYPELLDGAEVLAGGPILLRGFGHATTAVRRLVRLAFDQLLLNRIHATCDADNSASANVLRRAGLREEGISRCDQRDHNGKVRGTLRFGLTILEYSDWSAAQAG